jgi:hypothetical protein
LGLGLFLALIFGTMTTLMLIGTVAGANLMLPVIAFEGSNGLDAVSRSLRYVFSQPLWTLFYIFLAGIYGGISYVVVRLFAFVVMFVTYRVILLGASVSPDSGEKLQRIWAPPSFFYLHIPSAEIYGLSEAVGAWMIRITVSVVIGFIVAYVMSYVFCSGTVIYSLLRRKIDGRTLTHVYSRLDDVIKSVDSPTEI